MTLNHFTKGENIMAEEKEKNTNGDKLIAEACKTYGIDPKYVLASRIDVQTGEAVILAHGGAKVRFKTGDAAAPLSPIAITGINPRAAKAKVIAGKGAKG
jgi:hypothetical protein